MRTAGRLRGLGLAVAVLLAAACSGASQSAGTTNTTPVKVGFILSLTGTFAANGKNEQNGWNLAVKELGSSVNGHKIVTTFADDQTDPNVALSDARELVEQGGVNMLEGPIAANAIGAVAGYAGPLGIPTDDLAVCSDQQMTNYKKFGNALTSDWSCDQPDLMLGQWAYDQGYRHISTVSLDYAALPAEDPTAIQGVRIAAHYCDGINTPQNTKFTTAYHAAYGVWPGYYSDAGYAKYGLLVAALKKLKGDPTDKKKLVSALKSTPILAPRGPVTLNPATGHPDQNIY